LRTAVYGVTVELATGRSIEYSWATHVKVNKQWELHIYHGRRKRVYLTPDEWLSHRGFNGHQVTQPESVPQVHLRPVPAGEQTILMPHLNLDRGWEPVPRPGS
jgi:hypothetical protein